MEFGPGRPLQGFFRQRSNPPLTKELATQRYDANMLRTRRDQGKSRHRMVSSAAQCIPFHEAPVITVVDGHRSCEPTQLLHLSLCAAAILCNSDSSYQVGCINSRSMWDMIGTSSVGGARVLMASGTKLHSSQHRAYQQVHVAVNTICHAYCR
jgi:hypothetical protein